jgi:hypothetical protein
MKSFRTVVALVALSLSACTLSGEDDPSTSSSEQHIVSDEQIARFNANHPEFTSLATAKPSSCGPQTQGGFWDLDCIDSDTKCRNLASQSCGSRGWCWYGWNCPAWWDNVVYCNFRCN